LKTLKVIKTTPKQTTTTTTNNKKSQKWEIFGLGRE